MIVWNPNVPLRVNGLDHQVSKVFAESVRVKVSMAKKLLILKLKTVNLKMFV